MTTAREKGQGKEEDDMAIYDFKATGIGWSEGILAPDVDTAQRCILEQMGRCSIKLEIRTSEGLVHLADGIPHDDGGYEWRNYYRIAAAA